MFYGCTSEGRNISFVVSFFMLCLINDVPKTRLKTYGDRSFAFAAPTEWNKLPMDIKQSTSLGSFKSNVKTHLLHMCAKLCKCSIKFCSVDVLLQ